MAPWTHSGRDFGGMVEFERGYCVHRDDCISRGSVAWKRRQCHIDCNTDKDMISGFDGTFSIILPSRPILGVRLQTYRLSLAKGEPSTGNS